MKVNNNDTNSNNNNKVTTPQEQHQQQNQQTTTTLPIPRHEPPQQHGRQRQQQRWLLCCAVLLVPTDYTLVFPLFLLIWQYKDAETDLELALKHCHRDAKRNKRRILTHLVPLRLRLGEKDDAFYLQRQNYRATVLYLESARTGMYLRVVLMGRCRRF